jgi:hypothetical protein
VSKFESNGAQDGRNHGLGQPVQVRRTCTAGVGDPLPKHTAALTVSDASDEQEFEIKGDCMHAPCALDGLPASSLGTRGSLIAKCEATPTEVAQPEHCYGS